MRLLAKDPGAWKYDVVDLDTGKRIPYIDWADDETGEYCAVEIAADGMADPSLPRPVKKGNIKIKCFVHD